MSGVSGKSEEKFQEVRLSWRRIRIPSVETVIESRCVSEQIRQWIREERLSLSVAGADGIVCETCSKPIRTGKILRSAEQYGERLQSRFISRSRRSCRRQSGIKTHGVFSNNTKRINRAWVSGLCFLL